MRFWLTSCCLILGMSLLAHAEALKTPSAPDRSQPPGISAPKALQMPKAQIFKLSNGIPVYAALSKDAHLTYINVIIKAGADKEPAGKRGVSYLTCKMLSEGTEKYDSSAFVEEAAKLGALCMPILLIFIRYCL